MYFFYSYYYYHMIPIVHYYFPHSSLTSMFYSFQHVFLFMVCLRHNTAFKLYFYISSILNYSIILFCILLFYIYFTLKFDTSFRLNCYLWHGVRCIIHICAWNVVNRLFGQYKVVVVVVYVITYLKIKEVNKKANE